MKVVMNLFESELSNWKEHDRNESVYYLVTEKDDLIGENLVLRLEKDSDLYKLAMCSLPCSNVSFIDEKTEFKVFDNVDDFRDYINGDFRKGNYVKRTKK